jgi:hypothetical protein
LTAISIDIDLAPPSMNLMLRKTHWYRKNQKALWMELIHAELGRLKLAQLRAWADLRHRMHVSIRVHHKRAFDPDNLVSCAKIPLDSLVELHCLAGDSTNDIDLDVSEVVGPRVKTCITLTHLGEPHGKGHAQSPARTKGRTYPE